MRCWRSSVVFLVVSAGAAAQPQAPAAFAVRYSASYGCPERAVFVANLLARTQRARWTEIGSDAVVFTVDLEPLPNGTRGTLRMANPGAAPSVREVEAGTCGEVVEALALVAALTIDPEAETAPLPAEAVEAMATTLGAQNETAPSSVPTVPPPAATPEVESTRPPPAAPAAPPPALPPPSPEREGNRRGIEVALGAQLELDVAPLGSPFLGWRGFVDARARRRGLLRPSVGASFAYGTDSYDEGELGNAELRWWAARIDVCPVDLARPPWIAVRPCAAFDLGQVSGSGKQKGDVELEEHDASFTWASGALLGRVDFEPLGPLLLRIEAAFVVPFTSEAGFELRGDSDQDTVVDVPDTSLCAGVGLGLRFP